MIKKITAVFLSVSVMLAGLSVPAAASTEIVEDVTESIETEYTAEYADSDTLLDGYLTSGVLEEYDIPALYSSDYNGNKLSGVSSVIYDEVKQRVENVAKGVTATTNFNIVLGSSDLADYSWTAQELGVSSLFADASETVVNKEAAALAAEKLLENKRAILSVIRDCPYELYWFSNQYTVQKKYSVSIKRSGDKVSLSFKSMTLVVGLKVAEEYRAANEYTIDASKTTAVNSAIMKVNSLVAAASGLDDDAKLNYYRQNICMLGTYDGNAVNGAYGSPWNIINLFDGDPNTNIVCEGYAKGFQYLCDLSSFSSGMYVYTVSGEYSTGGTTGGHMWNIVRKNGENYLVDLTNCDGAVPSTKLYMVTPESGSLDEGYVFIADGAEHKYSYYNETRLVYSDSELIMKTASGASGNTGSDGQSAKLETSRTLEFGTSGSDVKALQEILADLGYDVGYPDGDFGNMTYNAVVAFQRDNGLYVDGVVGNMTVAAINEILGTSNSSNNNTGSGNAEKPSVPASGGDTLNINRSLSWGDQGDDVSVLQKKLSDLGYNVGAIDGDFGNMTYNAVIAFQQANGLLADGIVGSITLGVLNGSAASTGGGTVDTTPSAPSAVETGTLSTDRSLQRGLYGDDVLILQTMLSQLGYNVGALDGDFGNMTHDAVSAFQADYGLYVDGIAGSITIGALNNLF